MRNGRIAVVLACLSIAAHVVAEEISVLVSDFVRPGSASEWGWYWGGGGSVEVSESAEQARSGKMSAKIAYRFANPDGNFTLRCATAIPPNPTFLRLWIYGDGSGHSASLRIIDKIGPGAPPVRTPKGWLTTFHSVDLDKTRGKNGWEPVWQKRYCAGIMLLDLAEPWKVVGLCPDPLLAPEAPYERNGFRNDVIFPGGMILEDSGEVKIYYGAADTVECLATADVHDLVAMCKPFSRA